MALGLTSLQHRSMDQFSVTQCLTTYSMLGCFGLGLHLVSGIFGLVLDLLGTVLDLMGDLLGSVFGLLFRFVCLVADLLACGLVGGHHFGGVAGLLVQTSNFRLVW
jgi:hypothetical protein